MSTQDIDIWENISSGKYKNQLPFPTPPKIPLELNLKGSQLTNDQIAALPEIKKRYEAYQEAYKAGVKAYQEEEAARLIRFENDCAASEGLTNHPKRGKVYGLAWDFGHSSGLGDVYSYYVQLAELVL